MATKQDEKQQEQTPPQPETDAKAAAAMSVDEALAHVQEHGAVPPGFTLDWRRNPPVQKAG